MARRSPSPSWLHAAGLLLPLTAMGCPAPALTPLPGGPPPEYEAPRSYNPNKSIDGAPLPTSEPAVAPAPPSEPVVEPEPPPLPTNDELPEEPPDEELPEEPVTEDDEG